MKTIEINGDEYVSRMAYEELKNNKDTLIEALKDAIKYLWPFEDEIVDCHGNKVLVEDYNWKYVIEQQRWAGKLSDKSRAYYEDVIRELNAKIGVLKGEVTKLKANGYRVSDYDIKCLRKIKNVLNEIDLDKIYGL